MSDTDEQFAFLLDVAKLINKAAELGFKLTAGEMFRTPDQQLIYVQSGRSKTMNSLHLSRRAVDFNFFIDNKLTYDKEKIAPLGAFWESLSPLNSWGGNGTKFVDTPHFSRGLTKPEWRRVTDANSEN